MLRFLLLSALIAAPALAQSDPALASTADRFHADLGGVTAMLATAALVHDETGSFPTTPYELLGSTEAGRVGLRMLALSDITVGSDGDQLVVGYTPLPQSPYVREDRVVRLVISRDEDGLYTGDYEIDRRQDPDLGGQSLPYDTAGRYRVDRAYGTACVDVAMVRDRLAAGAFAAEPGTLGPTPLTIRIHPVGESVPVYDRTTSR